MMTIANLRSLANPRVPLSELNLNMLLNAPVLALPMQEGAGVNVADISGFGCDGAFGAAPAAPSWHQRPDGLWYLGFDGNDDIVRVLSPVDWLFPNLSVKYWINPTSVTGDYIGHVRLGEVSVAAQRLNIAFYNSLLQVYTFDAAWHNTGISIPTTTWSQLWWVKDTANLKLFVNGADSGWSMVHNTPVGGFDEIHIGRHVGTLDGYLTILGAYPMAPTPAEITNDYNREKHFFDVSNGNILARLLKTRELAVLR